MKNTLALLAGMVLCFSVEHGFAQPMLSAKIGTVSQVGQTVELSVTAEEQFYFAGNRYVLYIGIHPFSIARQTDTGGKGQLTFLIPANEFSALPEGGRMYLSYGDIVDMDESGAQGDERASSVPNACKYLGVFTAKMLGH
ncbi:MAG TPA: hypothetical protein VL092_13055 [Chitinophagaceae bacterium]|nr:hypothetical protein [Chitinophagaceae bacterium]